MLIPAEIIALVERLNRDLNEIEQEAMQGLNRARVKLSRFPDDALLVQLFVYLSNVLLFEKFLDGKFSLFGIVLHLLTYLWKQYKKLEKIYQHC